MSYRPGRCNAFRRKTESFFQVIFSADKMGAMEYRPSGKHVSLPLWGTMLRLTGSPVGCPSEDSLWSHTEA